MQDQLVKIERDVAEHPRADDLARLVHTVASTAADERRTRFGDGLEELASEAKLDHEATVVAGVDVFATLRDEAPAAQARLVVAVLLGRAVALAPPGDETTADRLADRLCWLSANSWLDALATAPRQMDDVGAQRFWTALSRLVKRSDERGFATGRGEVLAAAAAIGGSSALAAQAEGTLLSATVSDPLLRAVLASGAGRTADEGTGEPPASAAEISGELVAAPLGPLGLVLQAITGILLLRYLGRFLGKLVGLKRPTTLRVARQGVTVETELNVLGRTLRRRELVIPSNNLARAMREARFPRLSLYAGLIALALGTYFGASLATDGVRVGSPSMLGVGAALIGLGLVVDLVFARLLPMGKGTHRVVFEPRRGRKVAVEVAEADVADRALQTLAPR